MPRGENAKAGKQGFQKTNPKDLPGTAGVNPGAGTPTTASGALRDFTTDFGRLEEVFNEINEKNNAAGNSNPTETLPNGTKEWRNANGELHRDDGPARIYPFGHEEWYRNGQLHREDGPAVTWSDGTDEWYRNGQLHRDDGPATNRGGTEEWYRNGKYHRDDGPAVIDAYGTKEWYRNGKLHREDGPAVVWSDGAEEWYRDGQLHREDGPAVMNKYGRYEWWRNGNRTPEPRQRTEQER